MVTRDKKALCTQHPCSVDGMECPRCR